MRISAKPLSHRGAFVALLLLVLVAGQILIGALCLCDDCHDPVCMDWSCCLCANPLACDLAVSACPQPVLTLIGLINPSPEDGLAPETAFEFDRPPKAIPAYCLWEGSSSNLDGLRNRQIRELGRGRPQEEVMNSHCNWPNAWLRFNASIRRFRLQLLALSVGIVWLCLAQVSCKQSAGSKTESPDPAANAEVATGEAAEHGEESEVSDLDRPIEELFAEECNHGIKAADCDICRPEIGVVKASDNLFQDGLLRTETASRARVEIPLSLTGEVQFDERKVAHVSTQAEGVVRGVFVMLGEKVRKNQPLFEIESIEIGEAEGACLEANAVLRLARSNHEREAELHRRGLLSEQEYQHSQQDLETAEIRAETALGKLTRLGMTLSDAQSLSPATARGRLVLRAPMDGTVLLLNAVSGRAAKFEESLATIGDNTAVWVWANLYERDLAAIAQQSPRSNLPATITVRAYPNDQFRGKAEFVSPAMEEATRTVKLRIDVENPDHKLLAGMFANIELFLPGDDEALVLPASAVLEDAGRSFIFIHHQGEFYVRRPVTVGRSWGSRTEVLAGLAGGETVVADGAFLLKSDILRSKMGAGCAD
ncbi:MAG: efflux RND transporter periplasmic adaptor subunit [candidate division Zixibacteria bacterium]|nr:efflux RND transporter periplasmic adaptor subunit [candidate division Zixibacteria bacterium]